MSAARTTGRLTQLQQRGELSREPRRRARTPTARPPAAAARAGREAVFLTPYPTTSICPASLLLYERLRDALARKGVPMKLVTCTGITGGTPEAALGKLLAAESAPLWVLHQAPPRAQRFFEDRRLPALVLGATPPGSKLATVESDYLRTTRLAFERLRAAGLPAGAIALVVPSEGPCTHLHTEAAFLAAGGAAANILRHPDHDLPDWVRTHHPLLRPGVRAAIVQWPRVAVTLLTYAGGVLGARIPENFALITLADDPALDMCLPEISRYARDTDKHAALVTSVALKVMRGAAANGALRAETPVRAIPGGTVPPARA